MFVVGCLELLPGSKEPMEKAFKKLLLTSVGADKSKLVFTEKEWLYCLEEAQKQSIAGVLFPVVKDNLLDENGGRIEPLFNEWLGLIVQTDCLNRNLNEKAKSLTRIFKSWDFQTCILKGQGVATLYPEPSLRQSGDIDIWVRGKQNDIIKRLREQFIGITNIDYVHSGITIFNDVNVEVHFRPSWLYNPFTNRKLQRFFKCQAEEQFGNKDEKLGFAHPTIAFNLVYSLIHINRHIFEEGIGLRQILDYYYILKHSNKQERDDAFQTLQSLHLRRFVSAVMFVLQETFGLDGEYLLCQPDIKEGQFLLDEIMRGGNFGQYDDRNKWFDVNQRFMRGLFNAKRNLRYLVHYPNEVLWIPAWKVWHWCWRKWKGYL